jgi:hypothetical protein
MIRLRLLRLFPFLSRWFEVAPACCGVCSTCVTSTAGTLLLPIMTAGAVGKLRGEGNGPPASEGAGELGEDGQVGVKSYPLESSHS